MKLGGFWFHFINFQIRAKESVFMKKTKRKYLQNRHHYFISMVCNAKQKTYRGKKQGLCGGFGASDGGKDR